MKKLITNIAIIITIILTSVNYSVGQTQLNVITQDTNIIKILVLVPNQSQPIYTYTYDGADLLLSDLENYTYESYEQGVFKAGEFVSLIDDSCTLKFPSVNGIDTTYYNIVVLFDITNTTASVNEIEVSNLNVYPNPVIDVLNISFDSNENVDVIVMDMSGRIVHNEPSSTLISGINLSDQPSGMYLVKIGNQTQRIIKQ